MYEAASSDPRKPSAPATGFPVSYSTSTTEAEVYSYSYGPVVVPVPPPHPKPIVEWSTGLCDCFSDWGNSCVTSGAIYSVISAIFFVIGVRWWCGWGWGWVYSCFYRSYMRQQYDLRGNACTDCLIHFFCEPCALCQEYRELQFRGFHMTIVSSSANKGELNVLGWHGNVEQRSRGVAMTVATAPPVEQGMNR
ncbi:hypothetical protein JHK87_013736 [Glycine soja]|nr:hypothetical protein JHK87_013736 [Glycine soja]